MSKNIVIIPARLGSKRIPYKNIRCINQEPAIAHTIRNCTDSGVFDRVLVSTESSLIAKIARENGAEVPYLRSETLAGDYATTKQVIQDVITTLALSINDMIWCIYPLSVFFDKKLIQNIRHYGEDNADNFVITVKKSREKIERMFLLEERNFLKSDFFQFSQKRTQDLPTYYVDAGQCYVGTGKIWLSEQPLLGQNSIGYVIDDDKIFDIDNEQDLAYLIFLFEKMKPNSNI